VLLCPALAAAQVSPPQQNATEAAAAPTTEARFVALKATGDAARSRGQLTHATRAYLEALAIRNDPTVHGRLGMVAAKARAYDAAAFHLLIAMQRNGGTKAERAEFAAQLAIVRPKVCLVQFEINVQGSDLRVDGRRFLAKGGFDTYFVLPGAHTAHASAPGYRDASARFEAPEGGEVTVPLNLERPELPPPPEAETISVLESTVIERASLTPAPPALVSGPYAPPGTKTPPELPFRAEVALGGAVSPYGMPSVGVGGNGMIGLRWQRFAVAADVRGLITPARGIGQTNLPGRASLWTASLLPCIIASFVDLCGTVNFSLMTLDIEGVELPYWDGFSVGFGSRVGARWQFAERFALVGYGEATMELRTLALRSGTDAGNLREDWRSPQVRLGLGVALAVTVAP